MSSVESVPRAPSKGKGRKSIRPPTEDPAPGQADKAGPPKPVASFSGRFAAAAGVPDEQERETLLGGLLAEADNLQQECVMLRERKGPPVAGEELLAAERKGFAAGSVRVAALEREGDDLKNKCLLLEAKAKKLEATVLSLSSGNGGGDESSGGRRGFSDFSTLAFVDLALSLVRIVGGGTKAFMRTDTEVFRLVKDHVLSDSVLRHQHEALRARACCVATIYADEMEVIRAKFVSAATIQAPEIELARTEYGPISELMAMMILRVAEGTNQLPLSAWAFLILMLMRRGSEQFAKTLKKNELIDAAAEAENMVTAKMEATGIPSMATAMSTVTAPIRLSNLSALTARPFSGVQSAVASSVGPSASQASGRTFRCGACGMSGHAIRNCGNPHPSHKKVLGKGLDPMTLLTRGFFEMKKDEQKALEKTLGI